MASDILLVSVIIGHELVQKLAAAWRDTYSSSYTTISDIGIPVGSFKYYWNYYNIIFYKYE